MIRLFIILCVLTAESVFAEDVLPGYLFNADYADVDVDDSGELAVPPTDDVWVQVELPHFTGTDNPAPRTTWYRIKLDDNFVVMDGEPVGIYFWRFSMNLRAWLNGSFVGGAGSFEDPITRNWNRPMLFVLPADAWRESDNEVLVQLASYPGWGYLAPPIVADYATLQAELERRHFWQVTTNQITAVISLMAAMIAFTFYLSNREETVYGVFGLLCLAWTIYCLSNFVQHSPVSAKVWWWLVHVSLDLYGVLLAIFARRLAGFKFAPVEVGLWLFGLTSAVLYGAAELTQIAQYNSYTHAVCVLIACGTLVFCCYRAYLDRQLEMIVFTGCMLLIVVFGVHDWLMVSVAIVDMWRTQFLWIQFGAPVLTLSMLAMLAHRYSRTLFARLDMANQVRMERERIFSDIHDDVGSILLSLIYAADNEVQAELARDALRETRAIIGGALAEDEDLLTAMQNSETEAQQRCEAAGLLLNWIAQDLEAITISDAFRYNVQRIVRELVSNAIKHGCDGGGASQIDVNVRIDDGQFHLSVRDDGNVTSVDEFVPGTGMSGILRRCSELNGSVSWELADPGCRVTVQLPLEKETR